MSCYACTPGSSRIEPCKHCATYVFEPKPVTTAALGWADSPPVSWQLTQPAPTRFWSYNGDGTIKTTEPQGEWTPSWKFGDVTYAWRYNGPELAANLSAEPTARLKWPQIVGELNQAIEESMARYADAKKLRDCSGCADLPEPVLCDCKVCLNVPPEKRLRLK